MGTSIAQGTKQGKQTKKKRKKEQTLGSIVAHPLRSQCLTLLADRVASPAELSVELGHPVGNVSYHVSTLWKAGVVEIVRERPVRGAIEHFYRAIARPVLSDEEIAELPIPARQAHAREGFLLAAANATLAFEAQTFGARADYHVSRVPLRVDEEGWKELRDLYADHLEAIFKIQERCAGRLAGEEGEKGIPVIAFNTFFEMPERKTE